VKSHFIFAVFRFHPTDPTVHGRSRDHQRAPSKSKSDHFRVKIPLTLRPRHIAS
jgi:hypothetical protein